MQKAFPAFGTSWLATVQTKRSVQCSYCKTKKCYIAHLFSKTLEYKSEYFQKIDVELGIFTETNEQLVSGLASLFVENLEHEPESRILKIVCTVWLKILHPHFAEHWGALRHQLQRESELCGRTCRRLLQHSVQTAKDWVSLSMISKEKLVVYSTFF